MFEEIKISKNTLRFLQDWCPNTLEKTINILPSNNVRNKNQKVQVDTKRSKMIVDCLENNDLRQNVSDSILNDLNKIIHTCASCKTFKKTHKTQINK